MSKSEIILVISPYNLLSMMDPNEWVIAAPWDNYKSDPYVEVLIAFKAIEYVRSLYKSPCRL